MDLGGFCRFAARENIRLCWRAGPNEAGTMYRIRLNVEIARHIRHSWRDCFAADRPLDSALAYMADKYGPFYAELIERQRSASRVSELV
jgi:hypothetical protein